MVACANIGAAGRSDIKGLSDLHCDFPERPIGERARGVNVAKVGYFNVHAPGKPLGDVMGAPTIKQLFDLAPTRSPLTPPSACWTTPPENQGPSRP